MRIKIFSGLVAATLALATPSSASFFGSDRYVSPGGEFSIAMQTTMDREFHVDKQNANGDIVLVDFQYAMAQAHNGFAQRTVEWLKLDKPVDAALYDAKASETVSGYLEGRFAGNVFTIATRQKQRDTDGRLVYVFSATGTFNGTPCAWQGSILFFDSGVALVSQLNTLNTRALLDADGLTDAELTAWASTIRPGK